MEEDGNRQEARLAEQALYGGDLGTSLGSSLATGSTCGGTSDYQPSPLCNVFGPSAPDVVYLWKAPWADTFTFSTVGSTFDTVLEVRPYNNTSQSLGCNDDIDVHVKQSQLSVSLVAGQVVQVIVDSYGTQCGSYKLNISGQSCGSGCKTPPGSCHQSIGTCTATGCEYAPKAAGTSCSDGNACTGSDKCDGAGRCLAGASVTCNSPPPGCNVAIGICKPATGCFYASRCAANQYCYNNTICCAGTGSEQLDNVEATSTDELGKTCQIADPRAQQ